MKQRFERLHCGHDPFRLSPSPCGDEYTVPCERDVRFAPSTERDERIPAPDSHHFKRMTESW